MKYLFLSLFVSLFLSSCHHNSQPAVKSTPAKGELAFLLNYDGQMPSEVGFLTNHVVERRLANMMKDSFEIFMSNTKYDRPIYVSGHVVATMFFVDSDRTEASAEVIMDIDKDAIWADYIEMDSLIEFAEQPSLPRPDFK